MKVIRNLKLSLGFIFFLVSGIAFADLDPLVITKTSDTEQKKVEGRFPINANFNFSASAYNPAIPEGSFSMRGTFDKKSRVLNLKGESWIKRPANYELVDLTGKINKEGTSFRGRVKFDGCKEFILKRTSRGGETPYSGSWEGSYICAQGVTSLKLILK